MEGVIFCCPPAWRKLLPPGVLGAERAEALAEQYWPLLVLTRRGCGELGDTAALCRVRRRGGAPGISPAGTSGSCGGAAAAAGPAAVAAATDKCPLCVVG